MRFFYTVIFYLLTPVILLRLLWRARKAPAYASRWLERFGFLEPLHTTKKVIWLHTVSVGEFIAALPLIKRLQAFENILLVVTTTTPTGSERVRAQLGDSVFHVYAPYDLPDVLSRFFNRVKPQLFLVMETELWPNTLAFCAKKNIPSLLVNARMSEKSARGYAKFSWLTRPMLGSLTKAMVQNSMDAARLNSLGLPLENTLVTGSIKFDISIASDLQQRATELKARWSQQGKRKIWIAASTHQGEDEIILAAFQQVLASPENKNILLVLVPRHPERFNAVYQLSESMKFVTQRRSTGVIEENTQVVIGDTMGELMLLFGASDIAFVGGSLVPNGGHNFIEPAAWSLPLLSGPYVFNFAEISQLLSSAGALVYCDGVEVLAKEVIDLLIDGEVARQRGVAALGVVNANKGALEKTLNTIKTYID